jgi:hypothetical protein
MALWRTVTRLYNTLQAARRWESPLLSDGAASDVFPVMRVMQIVTERYSEKNYN